MKALKKKMNPRMKYDKHLIVVITSHLVQGCYYEAINYMNNATALEEGTFFQRFISFSLFLPGSNSRNRGEKYLISSLNFATFFFSTLSSTSFFFFSCFFHFMLSHSLEFFFAVAEKFVWNCALFFWRRCLNLFVLITD